jgi:hypothetical protein
MGLGGCVKGVGAWGLHLPDARLSSLWDGPTLFPCAPFPRPSPLPLWFTGAAHARNTGGAAAERAHRRAAGKRGRSSLTLIPPPPVPCTTRHSQKVPQLVALAAHPFAQPHRLCSSQRTDRAQRRTARHGPPSISPRDVPVLRHVRPVRQRLQQVSAPCRGLRGGKAAAALLNPFRLPAARAWACHHLRTCARCV